MKVSPVVLVFILGTLRDCQPLKCFVCQSMTVDGNLLGGDRGCDNVKGSTRYLKECEADQTQCQSSVGIKFDDDAEGHVFVRQCFKGLPEGCSEMTYQDIPIVSCTCEQDACNTNHELPSHTEHSKKRHNGAYNGASSNKKIMPLTLLMILLLAPFLTF